MELKHVKIFVLAAEHRNFSKVADLAFMSQSSVSKYIKSLEDELGSPLFLRDGRKTNLSEFGKLFLPYAYALLETEQQSMQVLHQRRSGNQYNMIRIGVDEALSVAPPELFYIKLMGAVNQLRKEVPGINFTLKYYDGGELSNLLESDQIDLAMRLMSNRQVENVRKHRTEFHVETLDMTQNYLAVSSDTDVSGGCRAVLSGVSTFIFDGLPIPQNMTISVLNQYGITPSTKSYRHWMDLYLDIEFGHGKIAAILPGNMAHIAKECGLQLIRMDDFEVCSGMVAFWKKDTVIYDIEDFVEAMKIKYLEHKEPENN